MLSALAGAGSPDSDPGLENEGLAGASAIVAELIVEAKGSLPVTETERWAAAPNTTGVLQGRFPARLQLQNARAGFETFRRQWNAQVVRETDNSMSFQVPFPGGFWKRWLEGGRGLLVEVRWSRPRPASAALPELSVRIRCPDKKKRPDETLVREVGPLLLDSLRSQLEAYPERRTQERVSWPHPVRARFLLEDNTSGEIIDGKGKDISLGGMGLYLPAPPLVRNSSWNCVPLRAASRSCSAVTASVSNVVAMDGSRQAFCSRNVEGRRRNAE